MSEKGAYKHAARHELNQSLKNFTKDLLRARSVVREKHPKLPRRAQRALAYRVANELAARREEQELEKIRNRLAAEQAQEQKRAQERKQQQAREWKKKTVLWKGLRAIDALARIRDKKQAARDKQR